MNIKMHYSWARRRILWRNSWAWNRYLDACHLVRVRQRHARRRRYLDGLRGG